MAIVAPGVEYRQLAGKSKTPLTHDIICVHTMVGTLEGSIAFSARPGNAYWHFGVGGNGKTVQCQDLQYRAAANLNGNWHVIPIETSDINEGHFPGTWQNPPWTPQQITALINVISWLCVRFNIPPVLVPDTRPGRRGLAYHRQGIDPWRISGGELWSTSTGKICPANRISQFIGIVIPAVQARVLSQGDDLPYTETQFIEMVKSAMRTAIADPADPFRHELRRIVQEEAGFLLPTPNFVSGGQDTLPDKMGWAHHAAYHAAHYAGAPGFDLAAGDQPEPEPPPFQE